MNQSNAAVEKSGNGDEAGQTDLLNAWPGDQVARHHLDLALWKSVQRGNLVCVRVLLGRGADANTRYQEESVLHLNVFENLFHKLSKRRLQLMEILLSHGADPDGPGLLRSHWYRVTLKL